jgi:hypothetical protein
MTIEFQEFPKIPRYRREVCVTEKIDGTNAAIVWHPAPEPPHEAILAQANLVDSHGRELGPYYLLAQSRNRFITPQADNYGFAGWVRDNVCDLLTLGPGAHYGEWWGLGIGRGYAQRAKRFSLFNVARWGAEKQAPPACCDVVPVLGWGKPDKIPDYLEDLRANGSKAAPGFMRPEGIIIWHADAKQYYKITLEKDEIPKSFDKPKDAVA